jgi:putative peptide zinc metalloprotease protein
LKALHELGHAFAVKHHGGEVHEMGILFLVFVPLPYVDASAAAAFADKWKRVAVGAAGIGVELVASALALFVWLAVEPGALRSLAHAVLWVGGASTLLFNGNPLLRFDGYYVLSDWIEIPNLRARSTRYLAYAVERYVFGLEKVRDPVTAPGERFWFVSWGLAAGVYRVGVVFAIALFVAERYLLVGVLLAALALATQLVLPLLRQALFVLRSPRLGGQRPRALTASALALAALLAAALLLPLPLSTRAQGVVWPPEGTHVRAGADGFVEELLVAPGARVATGQPLLRTRDAAVEAELAVGEARLREVRARYRAARGGDRVAAQNLRDELEAAESARDRARERAVAAVVRSPGEGRFVAPDAGDLLGRFVEQGELLGYVVGPSISTARVVIPQDSASLVQQRTRRVELRHSRRPGRIVTARVAREVPAATDLLPSAALGSLGGGPFAVDPGDARGLRTTRSVFQLELELPASAAVAEIGGRVHVRFDHGAEPIAWRGIRAVRRLLLSRIGV